MAWERESEKRGKRKECQARPVTHYLANNPNKREMRDAKRRQGKRSLIQMLLVFFAAFGLLFHLFSFPFPNPF